jgi:hypothetical protein
MPVLGNVVLATIINDGLDWRSASSYNSINGAGVNDFVLHIPNKRRKAWLFVRA